MKDKKYKPIFVGPSIGMSILCTIPLVLLKLFRVFDISWIWITCPIWLGWAICFVLWLWFSSLNIVCKCIKPIYIPIFIKESDEKIDENKKEKGIEDGM